MKTITYNEKEYKVVYEKYEKPLLYPGNMNNKIIKALEECRKSLLRGNKITTLIFGDTETGKSWNEMNDIKGRISITRGTDYSFPIFVNFKEKYDYLNGLTNSDIKKELKEKNLLFLDILSDGGGLIGNSIIGVKLGDQEKGILYKHPLFHNDLDFNKIKITSDEYNISNSNNIVINDIVINNKVFKDKMSDYNCVNRTDYIKDFLIPTLKEIIRNSEIGGGEYETDDEEEYCDLEFDLDFFLDGDFSEELIDKIGFDIFQNCDTDTNLMLDDLRTLQHINDNYVMINNHNNKIISKTNDKETFDMACSNILETNKTFILKSNPKKMFTLNVYNNETKKDEILLRESSKNKVLKKINFFEEMNLPIKDKDVKIDHNISK